MALRATEINETPGGVGLFSSPLFEAASSPWPQDAASAAGILSLRAVVFFSEVAADLCNPAERRFPGHPNLCQS